MARRFRGPIPGFTILELLFALAITGTLTAIAVPHLVSARPRPRAVRGARARRHRARADAALRSRAPPLDRSMTQHRDRDRRQDDRAPARGVSARVRRGYQLEVIDMSARGALVEGRLPLRPGSYVDVHLESPARRETMAARVVRCAVSAIDAEAGITYRAALAFTTSCDWV